MNRDAYIGVHSGTRRFVTVDDLDHMLDTDVVIISFIGGGHGRSEILIERTVAEIKEAYDNLERRIG